MKTVIIIQSGLMEYEGNEYVYNWGQGEGETLQEVCEDIIQKNPEKGENFSCEAPDKCYDWGFTLKLLN